MTHSSEMYKDGQKFEVVSLDRAAGTFRIRGEERPDMSKKVRWGLAKDDVTLLVGRFYGEAEAQFRALAGEEVWTAFISNLKSIGRELERGHGR